MDLEFSEHNFKVLQQAYKEMKAKYDERGMAMASSGATVRSLFMKPLRRIKTAMASLVSDYEVQLELEKIIREFERHTPITDRDWI